METRDLLLTLNQKSKQQHIKYVLQYNYQYSEAREKVYSKVLILKYLNNKLTEMIKLRPREVVNYLGSEMLSY